MRNKEAANPKLDPDIVGRRSKPVTFEYSWKDVVLYALGVGATAHELPFVYEEAPGGLKVLPSFCVLTREEALPDLGDDIIWPLMIHGEQEIRIFSHLPAAGKVVQVGEVLDLYDKGKGALIRIRVSGSTEEGTRLYETIQNIFYLGAGGFGGDPGPKAVPIVPPEGTPPDFICSQKVAENQAVLYRLCGDVNPLHVDDKAARMAGFHRPVLHGLCTYGFATRAIVNELLAGEVARFRSFRARFMDAVFPGDTLTTEGWRTEDGIIIQARTQRSLVLGNAMAVVHRA